MVVSGVHSSAMVCAAVQLSSWLLVTASLLCVVYVCVRVCCCFFVFFFLILNSVLACCLLFAINGWIFAAVMLYSSVMHY